MNSVLVSDRAVLAYQSLQMVVKLVQTARDSMQAQAYYKQKALPTMSEK